MQKLRKVNSLVLLLVLLIPACWALFVPGFYGASDEVHIAWLYEMDQVLKLGQIPARFVPDLSYGFGYPLFNFVFPLPYYLAEVFHLMGFSFVDSIKLLFFITIPLSCFAMFVLLRQLTSRNMALIGALLYAYTPYRSVDIYVRGAIGEVMAFVFFPLIVWSIIKLADSENRSVVIGIGGLSIASLVLTHNIAAYMMMPLFAVLMGLFVLQKKNVQLFINYIGMVILGAVTSIFFWLPALMESSLMKYDTVFNFVDHYPTVKQLFIPYWGYGGSIPGPGDGMSFFLGVPQLIVFIFACAVGFFMRRKLTSRQLIVSLWALGSIGLALVMMNYRSIPLWNAVPFIPYFQFPWRFLMVTTFSIPLLVIALEQLKLKNILMIGLLGLILTINSFYFRPQDFLGRTDQYFLDKYIPKDPLTESYRQNQEEYLRLPKDTQKRPDQLMPRFYTDQGQVLSTEKLESLDAEATIVTNHEQTINYAKYMFPGWQGRIDGQSLVLKPGQPFGQISFTVPSGTHKVEIFYKEPEYKMILDGISLLSYVVTVGLLMRYLLIKGYNKKSFSL